MTTTNKFRMLLTAVKTSLPDGHTKAERIEELKAILTTDPNKLDFADYSYRYLINQLNRLDDEQYMSIYSVKDKSHLCSNGRPVWFNKCKGGELSISRKADLLMTNMSIISSVYRPVPLTEAYELVHELEKENISPLTMIGAIHAYWVMILGKEFCTSLVEDKRTITHQLSDILRVTTEAVLNEIIIEPITALRSALIKFASGGSENKICAEYILNTPSQFEFLRRAIIGAATSIVVHRRKQQECLEQSLTKVDTFMDSQQ